MQYADGYFYQDISRRFLHFYCTRSRRGRDTLWQVREFGALNIHSGDDWWLVGVSSQGFSISTEEVTWWPISVKYPWKSFSPHFFVFFPFSCNCNLFLFVAIRCFGSELDRLNTARFRLTWSEIVSLSTQVEWSSLRSSRLFPLLLLISLLITHRREGSMMIMKSKLFAVRVLVLYPTFDWREDTQVVSTRSRTGLHSL